MNAALFAALKPGGVLVVVDHSAKKGEGTGVAKSLHRIEESVVLDEVKKAGFVLDGESDFLRHPEDPRDWSASDEAPMEKRGTSDRFALRFKKP
jgi:predicted methyltransferase